MSEVRLHRWVQKLSLQDRLKVQMFMVRLYAMEKKNGK